MYKVYAIVEMITGRSYIGSSHRVSRRFSRHKSDLRAGRHHCIFLQAAWNLLEEGDFELHIVQDKLTKKAAQELETKLIEQGLANDTVFNINTGTTGGDTLTHHPYRDDILQKRIEAHQQAIAQMTKEERQVKWRREGSGNPMFGRTHTQEAKDRISQANKGNQYAKGAERSAEVKQNLSRIASQRVGDKNPFYGRHHSAETRAVLAEKNRGRKPINCKPVSINGTVYESVSEAGRVLNIPTPTVVYRLKSRHYEEYNYHDC